MTTHYEKIQALGNRMASNLETMGVSASFSDGGLTLADKILQIQYFTNGLLLYADKNIIQIDDTVNLYALLLEDAKSISGETIKFDFGTIVSSKQVSLGDDLYDDYYVESSKTGSNYDYIGTAHSGFIQFNSSIIKTYVSSFSPEITYNGEPFHIKNGVLTYKDTSDVERTIDVSAIDTSKAYSGASCTIHYHWIEATTGSDGVATVSYTGVGAGKLNVRAKTIDGIIQSEIFVVYDTITFDNAIASDYNDIWELANATLTREATYSQLTETNVGTNAYIYADFPNVQTIEFDVLQEDGGSSDALFSFYQNTSGKSTLQLRHLAEEVELNAWYRVKCLVEENKVTIINKDTEYQTIREFSGVINRGRFATSGTTIALQFRNFKAY